MDKTLIVISIAGLAVSFIAGINSQVWKGSIEVPGKLKKQLTPFGWLSVGISLIGLSASVGSVLIGVSLRKDEQLQAKTEAAQKQALLEQEQRWQIEVSKMLATTKSGIETNLTNTINGFRDNQDRFNRTQADIVNSKQSLLESSLRHTNEIVVAGQPLTSLSFHWEFSSNNAALEKEIREGEEAIAENNESVQGRAPAVPYDVMEYQSTLIPLLSHVARFGSDDDEEEAPHARQALDTVVVLIPLDESENAILSFGYIESSASWSHDGDAPSISAGFLKSFDSSARIGNSNPSVTANLAAHPERGRSSYTIGWNLDPGTLANAFDRKNIAIAPTAKLPRVLKVAILYNVTTLPFEKNNFGSPYATNLWHGSENLRRYIDIGKDMRDAVFTIQVNGFQPTRFRYVLKKMYELNLMNEHDDEIDTACTMLEFEAGSGRLGA